MCDINRIMRVFSIFFLYLEKKGLGVKLQKLGYRYGQHVEMRTYFIYMVILLNMNYDMINFC